MMVFLMFTLITPVQAMPDISINKVENTFQKESIVKATVASYEISNTAESHLVSVLFLKNYKSNVFLNFDVGKQKIKDNVVIFTNLDAPNVLKISQSLKRSLSTETIN